MHRIFNAGCRQKAEKLQEKSRGWKCELCCFALPGAAFSSHSFSLGCLIDQLFMVFLASHLVFMITKVYLVQITIYYSMPFCLPQVYTPITVSLSALWWVKSCKYRIRSGLHNMTCWENPNKAGVPVYKLILYCMAKGLWSPECHTHKWFLNISFQI